ncbi:hypothetical protein F4775DRAFT_597410 [Biscogniauxia sp. FL1348]|nr:hypothetical protein F4775DRAFT_597410 [Biscogniauxia sp. FL1348]
MSLEGPEAGQAPFLYSTLECSLLAALSLLMWPGGALAGALRGHQECSKWVQRGQKGQRDPKILAPIG